MGNFALTCRSNNSMKQISQWHIQVVNKKHLVEVTLKQVMTFLCKYYISMEQMKVFISTVESAS